MTKQLLRRVGTLLTIYLGLAFIPLAFAQNSISIHGTVHDPLGAVIEDAQVDLLQKQQPVASAKTDGQGNYTLQAPATGRYQLRLSATSFKTTVTDSRYISSYGERKFDVTLSPCASSLGCRLNRPVRWVERLLCLYEVATATRIKY